MRAETLGRSADFWSRRSWRLSFFVGSEKTNVRPLYALMSNKCQLGPSELPTKEENMLQPINADSASADTPRFISDADSVAVPIMLLDAERDFEIWFSGIHLGVPPYLVVLDPRHPHVPVYISTRVNDAGQRGTFASFAGIVSTKPQATVQRAPLVFTALPPKSAIRYFVKQCTEGPLAVVWVVGSLLDAAVIDLVPGVLVVWCRSAEDVAPLVDEDSPVAEAILSTATHILIRVRHADDEERLARIHDARVIEEALVSLGRRPVFVPFATTAGEGSESALRDLHDVFSEVILPSALESNDLPHGPIKVPA